MWWINVKTPTACRWDRQLREQGLVVAEDTFWRFD